MQKIGQIGSRVSLNTCCKAESELDMDWIHPWIGLDWIGSDDCNPLFFSFIYFLY